MANVAYLPIEVDRYGAAVRQIYIRGLDLTGIAMRAQVRLGGDVPGPPLIDLQAVTNASAEGLRFLGVTDDAGVPVSHVQMTINETTIKALPYAGELGSETALAWDWQITLAGRKQRVAKGPFVITGDGVTGSDTAPANRAAAWSNSFSRSSGMRTGATLTFGSETISVAIDGADLLGPLASKAQQALDKINDFTRGDTGPANSTFKTKAAMLAAPPTNASYIFAPPSGSDDGTAAGTFLYQTAGAPYTADDVNILQLDMVPLGEGALVRQDATGLTQRNLAGAALNAGDFLNALPLFAINYGVVDDPNIHLEMGWLDQSAAVQAFLDLCQAQHRPAHFGPLRVALASGVVATHTPIIFDTLGAAFPQPGFWPKRLAGAARYTAVTFYGTCPGIRVAVRGTGEFTVDPAGDVTSDTRPQVDGVQFGDDAVYGNPFSKSFVETVDVTQLGGFGIRRIQCWDSTFATITVEKCGRPGDTDICAAFIDDYTPTVGFVNETITTRLQVENCCQRAIFIHPNTLSCAYPKIHSEGAFGKDGINTWLIGGGNCSYGAPRFSCENTHGTLSAVGSSTIKDMRAENCRVVVNPIGGVLNFIGGGGDVYPSAGMNGLANFEGFEGNFYQLISGFKLRACKVNIFEVSSALDPSEIVADGCNIQNVRPLAGSTTSRAAFDDCRIDNYAALYHAVFDDGTRAMLPQTYTLGYCRLDLNNSKLRMGNGTGTLTLDHAFLNATGAWLVDGAGVQGPAAQSLFNGGGWFTRGFTGYRAPVGVDLIGPHIRGMKTFDPAPSAGGPPGHVCVVNSPDLSTPGVWKPMAALGA